MELLYKKTEEDFGGFRVQEQVYAERGYIASASLDGGLYDKEEKVEFSKNVSKWFWDIVLPKDFFEFRAKINVPMTSGCCNSREQAIVNAQAVEKIILTELDKARAEKAQIERITEIVGIPLKKSPDGFFYNVPIGWGNWLNKIRGYRFVSEQNQFEIFSAENIPENFRGKLVLVFACSQEGAGSKTLSASEALMALKDVQEFAGVELNYCSM
jgi:hypothetical protein